MRLHGYDLDGFSQGCESFQQLHRKGRGKLGLVSFLLPLFLPAVCATQPSLDDTDRNTLVLAG
jgi:hypothetical protein